ncbi:NUDIX hydrolase [Tepidiphilus olei]|uniref:NUDIX hydrolase n=1 Tax=Tepidiphilus olei TaxID=2502184 RepID=UPI00115DD927|nr:NUDIX hydrolase [Tepidiphilus olei]MDD3432946.1 NUDIX hydrolase [Tepidiphilus sp.]
MKYCSLCGHPLRVAVPPGDNRPRHVCGHCGEVHYQNPKVVVGAIARWEDRVLLCRRAIEPRLGWWTLPAGFMENGESTMEAAMRETWEEAGALIEVEDLHALIDVPPIQQVHLFYRARLLRLDIAPGEESLETRLFRLDDIPWGELAFETVRLALRHEVDAPGGGILVTSLGSKGSSDQRHRRTSPTA